MPNTDQKPISLQHLAEALNLEYRTSKEEVLLTSVASLSSATTQDICFLNSDRYLEKLHESLCAAVIVPLDFKHEIQDKALLFSKNPHLSFVQAISLLNPDVANPPKPCIHPSAQISKTAKIGENVSIAANTVIAEGVQIFDHVSIGSGCVIEKNSVIGEHSKLHANVTLCHDVKIGDQVILHPGVVIGSDGFGLVYDEGDWVKIPHIGRVLIGDRVEIGANTTVDRGALDDTVLENGVKLDNQIQVAHNVRIGENTAIAACVGIAGSAIIGKNCKISGAAVVLGHLSVADNVTITAMSLVTKSISKSGTYSSGTPLLENRLWHRNNARYKNLDNLARSVAELEKTNK